MTKQQKVSLIGTILLFGFCVASYLYYIIGGDYFQAHYPLNTFLFDPSDKFNDFFNVLRMAQHRDAYLHDSAYSTNIGLTANYFPFLYSIMHILGKIGNNEAFAIYLVSLISMMSYLSYRFLWKDEKLDTQTKLAALGIAFFSFPFLFCIDRGNVEAFVFIFTGFFFLSFMKGKYKTAAVFIALASAMKLYPCVLAWLFIKKKQYKACVISGVLTIAISVASMLTMKGGFMENFNGLIRELGHFTTHYTLYEQTKTDGFLFDIGFNGVSLFGVLRHIGHFIPLEIGVSSEYMAFNIFAVMILMPIIYYVLKYENELWKHSFILSSFTILFMGTSFDYKMLSLLLSLFLFINTPSANFDRKYCILFAILFIPKALPVTINGYGFSISDTFNALLILYINYSIIKERLFTKTA